jgi:hypothetical protein
MRLAAQRHPLPMAAERIVLDVETRAHPSSVWSNPAPQSVEAALLCTLAYADLFDYPLTAAEVHRYLVGMVAEPGDVRALLSNGCTPRHVVQSGIYFTLPGREQIVEIRDNRAAAAADLWPTAIHYGQAIARLPFVRLVAVTGALAVDNAEPGDDIDYLVVTAPDRLWLCRAMIIQFVVKPAARLEITLCPNYLLSERALARFEQNLFTAHEIVQMVPVAGHDTYGRLCHLNRWAARFLPNAYGRPRCVDGRAQAGHSPLTAAEPILKSRAGGWLEQWEMKRKIGRFEGRRPGESDASFSADWCKGHFESHAPAVRDAFARRLEALAPGVEHLPGVGHTSSGDWGAK